MKLAQHIRSYLQQPLVRPWALAGPVLILMLCLPLLRPLREPDSRHWHNEEQMIAATVQSIVEQHSLAIDDSVFATSPAAVRHAGHLYSPYPPMLPVLLAPVYWVLMKQDLNYSGSLIFVQYLLILFGAALPVAFSVGLVYRLGRMFELHRLLRVGLGIAAVVGGGVLSYGVVLNRHAPAAFLLLIAISCISHLAVAGFPQRQLLIASLGGFCAALACAIDPQVLPFAVLLSLGLLVMRWRPATRIWALILYLVGAAPVVTFNLLLLLSVGQPLTQALAFRDPAPVLDSVHVPVQISATAAELPPQVLDRDEDMELETGFQAAWQLVAAWLGRLLEGLIGPHGILSHFPVLLLGLFGATLVLHRNWTATTKTIAAITLLSGLLLCLGYSFRTGPMTWGYGSPWFVTLSPALMLWSGAWLKRRHRPQSWVMAGLAMAFSLCVAIAGMTNPMPRAGYGGYSFADAAGRLFHSLYTPSPPQER